MGLNNSAISEERLQNVSAQEEQYLGSVAQQLSQSNAGQTAIMSDLRQNTDRITEEINNGSAVRMLFWRQMHIPKERVDRAFLGYHSAYSLHWIQA